MVIGILERVEKMKSYIKREIQESIQAKQRILEDSNLLDTILEATDAVLEAYKRGNKTLIAGNGGSAADAQHIAAEFVSRFAFDRPGIPSIALTTDSSILTAVGNDYGFDRVFARQVEANGVEGDIFIAISTSGNSTNILEAINSAKSKHITTIGLTGEDGGKMADICDITIKVPSSSTPRIQESHIMIGHIICAIVEEELFGKGFDR